MRTDAQRNLRHVLDAARDVFGEQGYDAPVEEVARRANVGVGTVYRRFPNKEALVRYVTELETGRLAERALSSLSEPAEPWTALEGFVRFASSARSGRLLPELFAVGVGLGTGAPSSGPASGSASGPASGPASGSASGSASGDGMTDGFAPGREAGGEVGVGAAGAAAERVPQPRSAPEDLDGGRAAAPVASPGTPPVGGTGPAGDATHEHTRELLELLSRLVERARLAGQLRSDASVADVLLVIATAPPPMADTARQAVLCERLLDILLQGLRPARG
ncbi:TetR/AcrR family transcriptional regulator [Streptomyces lonarensis]|uniref:TetR/AcrR family transcriptional regulator n=1 Tax=Streptomyces lonarensis TaxID=700599 RepID=UPI0028AE980C|nr:helix-turn-helix domain-containing protein [Streptomyces lonarensis]